MRVSVFRAGVELVAHVYQRFEWGGDDLGIDHPVRDATSGLEMHDEPDVGFVESVWGEEPAAVGAGDSVEAFLDRVVIGGRLDCDLDATGGFVPGHD